MNERLLTRELAELLAGQTKLDKKRAEMFLYAMSAYIVQCIETRKAVKINGFGAFKIVLVRERESVHIQTGEHFIIPAHHRLSFIPDKEFKDYINRAFQHKGNGMPSRYAIPETIYEYEDYMDETINQLLAPDMNESYGIPQWDEPTREIFEHEDILVESETKYADETDAVVISNVESVDVEDVTEENEVEIETLTPAALKETDTQNNESLEAGEDSLDDDFYHRQIEIAKEQHPEYDSDTSKKTVVAADATDAVVADETKTVVETKTVEAKTPDTEEHSEGEDNTDEAKKSIMQTAVRKFAGLLVFPPLRKQTADVSDDASAETIDDGEPKKPIVVPLWLWFVLLPLLIISGVGAGTYAFLHWNANGGAKDLSTVSTDVPEPFAVADTMYVDALSTDTAAIASGDSTIVEKDTVTPQASNYQEKKPTIDWLASSPPKNKQEPKRVDRDVRPSTQTASRTADKAKTPTDKKTFPMLIRVSAGSNLYRMAEEYYGNMYFWVYIYEHNKRRIPDYRKISIGTEIYLPEPKTYGINANNPASVEKAKKKAAEIAKKNEQ